MKALTQVGWVGWKYYVGKPDEPTRKTDPGPSLEIRLRKTDTARCQNIQVDQGSKHVAYN